MAGLDVAAGVVGIASFLGQVIQDCIYLNSLIGDIRGAPKEVEDLWNEINLVRTSITQLQTIYQQISQSTTKPTIIDPVDELRYYGEAMAALTALLKPSLDAFDNGTPTKRNWNRLKHALGKETVKVKLDTLSRARLSIIAFQSNMQL